MNYYLDTEFLEGTQRKLFGQTKPTIDLISIGIVAEDGREYYAISKDFNLKEGWNRNDLDPNHKRNYKQKDNFWIRENVLKPIYKELRIKELNEKYGDVSDMECYFGDRKYFKQLKRLVSKYGKSNKQIAKEVIEFTKPMHRYYSLEGPDRFSHGSVGIGNEPMKEDQITKHGLKFHYPPSNPVFHTYYGSYDHVVFCWLFGRMIDLPKGFPMYSVDLKQLLDEKVNSKTGSTHQNGIHFDYSKSDFNTKLQYVKMQKDYPTQQNEHNALSDARRNKKLHEFIKSL